MPRVITHTIKPHTAAAYADVTAGRNTPPPPPPACAERPTQTANEEPASPPAQPAIRPTRPSGADEDVPAFNLAAPEREGATTAAPEGQAEQQPLGPPSAALEPGTTKGKGKKRAAAKPRAAGRGAPPVPCQQLREARSESGQRAVSDARKRRRVTNDVEDNRDEPNLSVRVQNSVEHTFAQTAPQDAAVFPTGSFASGGGKVSPAT